MTRDEQRLDVVLRVAAAMCFIGHGAFGVITKEAWVAFFAVAGIGRDTAFTLMPVVGVVDILLGISMLWPTRFALAYMTVWAVWTALLRPLSGQPFAETLERAGNYGVPAALLFALLVAPAGGGWFARLRVAPLDPERTARLSWFLRLTTATLLVGHGLLAASGKAQLVNHLTLGGIGSAGHPPAGLVLSQGGFEIGLGLAVLLVPAWPLAALALAWKLATELLFPMTGDSFWEFVERGGSYGAPLALLILSRATSPSQAWTAATPSPAAATNGA